VAVVLATVGLSLLGPPAHAAAPVNTVPPSITGTPEYDAELTADPGQWSPAAASYSYQWLRDGQPIPKATAQTYRTVLDDLDHRLSVTVTADDGAGATGTSTSAETEPVRRADIKARGGQKIVGVARYGHTLTGRTGRFSVEPMRVGYQWRRNGEDIQGAIERRYEVRPEDVGSRLRVTISVKAPGYQPLDVTTDKTDQVRHRVDVRRVVSYHIETRGHITTSVKEFARLAQQTYADARGWRGAGIQFHRVAHGCSPRPGSCRASPRSAASCGAAGSAGS
jgi:hypothetical protein